MVCMWFGELCYCSCLPVLPCHAWVLLGYVLQTIFLYPVLCRPFSVKFGLGVYSFTVSGQSEALN